MANQTTTPRRPYGRIALLCLPAGAVLVGLALLRGAGEPAAQPSPVAGDAVPSAPASSAASVSPSPSPPPVYQLPGDFPASGPGTWKYAPGKGDVLGSAGGLRRFRVAAETNIAGAELAEFTRTVDRTLGDPRSWIGGRERRLQRVPAGAAYDFTIYLATGETTRKLCALGGMDTRLDGVSYTSCRLPGRVVINLNRWRLSVPDYVNGRIELSVYRSYVINHEVGHEFGRNHERCPGKGRPAPTMQQQTYGLRGCRANPWPYLDGRRYAGPPM
ncbi:DUF3152 domain-containing protein [Catellatospora coxensis]|uniref:DUF3152 domain-containing protein n=1 Tax=Catellatospora coxensis TaxID=310354 RepID=UPI001EF354F0|nr:DUF3152 domain-containing protein [Catellatospora coxensis]